MSGSSISGPPSIPVYDWGTGSWLQVDDINNPTIQVGNQVRNRVGIGAVTWDPIAKRYTTGTAPTTTPTTGGGQPTEGGGATPPVTPPGGNVGGGGETGGGGDGDVDPLAGFDPDIAAAVMGTYNSTKDYLGKNQGTGRNAAQNNLRERIGSVANQQREGVINDFVGRGIGASPIIKSQQGLGGINTAEQQSVANGMIDLDSKYEDRYLQGMGALNDATQNVLGMGSDSNDYDTFIKKLNQDAYQFNKDLDFRKTDADKERASKERLAKLVNSGQLSGELLEFIKQFM